MAFVQFVLLQLAAQDSSVKILRNDEARFRFDSIQLGFINSGFHVMIGDSTGMDNAANARTIENTFIGHKTGSKNQANWNTFLGARAGENNLLGWDNVFIGTWAGRWDSTGQCNTYVGSASGSFNKTGWNNTYLGYGTGFQDSAGRNNVFIGYLTGWKNTTGRLNAFIGTNAGFSNTSGIENTYLGTTAGGSNTTGNSNTCLGRRAGMWNQTGSGNVFIGYYAGANEMGSNKLYISNSDTIAPLIYGEFDNGLLKLNAETRVVNHDVYITDPAKGVILKSPGGNCWRVRVMDNGTLITEQVSPCPQ